MMPIKSCCIVVDRMNDDGPDPGDFGGGETTPECVGQQVGSKSDATVAMVERQAADEEQRNLFGHSTTQLGVGK